MSDTATKTLRQERMKVEKKRRDIRAKIERLQRDDEKLRCQLDNIDEGIKKLENV